jgi:hypothetical protein
MASPSNRYMNFGLFSFAGVPFTGITEFNFDLGLSYKKEGADGDPGPTVGTVDFQDPTFTFTTLDAMSNQANLGGVRGIFIATILDSQNKAAAGGGAKQFVTNALAMLSSASTAARYREYASRQCTVQTIWADPATYPVSTTSL